MQPSVSRTWIVAKVVITSPDNLVLAIRRSHTAPHQALRWDLPGGLIEYGEDPVKGSIRETLEETGLHISNIIPILVASARPRSQYEICLYFKAPSIGTEVKLSYEHDRFMWVTPAEFADLDADEGYKAAVALVAK